MANYVGRIEISCTAGIAGCLGVYIMAGFMGVYIIAGFMGVYIITGFWVCTL